MEHIRNIEIKNFKSIRHQKIEDCRRINVFIGYPNVGKSNILEALGFFSILLLRNQSFKLDEICRLKHFSELYFNRDIKDAARVIINNNVEIELIIDESNQLQLRANELPYSKTTSSTVFSVTVKDDFLFNILVSKGGYNFNFDGVKRYDFDKNVTLNGKKPRALAVPSGDNLLNVLLGDLGLRKEIVDLFKIYNLKLNLDTVDNSIKFLKELDDETTVTIPYYQIADTLRRLIFYKAAISTNENSVLLFEEPEAHMFPPYIRKLTADIMFDDDDNQYFIATHSPFVLEEFIAEKRDDLSIYVVDYDKGETVIKRLTDDEVIEVAQYGVDLFFNLESYLDRYAKPHSA